jgi:HK97 family phage portal protein
LSWISRLLAGSLSRQGAKEGQFRQGPYYLPVTGGWLSEKAGQFANWWQMGYSVENGGSSAMVEACVAAYAQTVAMCPGNHWYWTKPTGRDRVVGSALTRVIRSPNDYQSISDFLLNMVYNLFRGNAYILIVRNNRFEPQSLHLFPDKSCHAQVAEGGEVFYFLSGNEVIEKQLDLPQGKGLVVPARDVIHIRLHCPRHPLVGESPLVAAALEIAAGNAALQQQIIFYANQARPSFLLTTDQILNQVQARDLRTLWEEQAKGLNAGGTPILSAGLKAQSLSTSAKDSQIAELMKMSDQAIANVFRVPLAMLGIGTTPVASTEALMQMWLASGLGFVLNHIEEAFGLAFKLKGQPDEYMELDTSALLRSSFKERIEAWAAGTTGGVFARNEARQDFELEPVDGGDEPWVQQQDIPLSVAFDNAKNPPPPPKPAPAPAPATDPAPADGQDPAPNDNADKDTAEAVTRLWESRNAA